MASDAATTSQAFGVERGAADERPTSRAVPRPSLGLPDAIAIAILLVAGVVIPVILGTVSGSILVPHNDDPSMRRAALGLFETGRLELNGWTSMTLVGQLLFVQPFLWLTGGSPWGFAVFTILFAVVGIVAGYWLVRRLLSVSRSALAVAGVLAFPGFLLNVTSFMTDVPTWSTTIACLALGAVALDRAGAARWRWLAASLAVGCFAFSIREFAVAAPAAVLVVAALSDRRAIRRYVAAGVLVGLVCLVVYVLAHRLPGQHEAPVQLLTGEAIRDLGLGFATLALCVSPAIVLAIAGWWRRWRVVDCLAGGLVGLLVYGSSLLTVLRTGRPPVMLVGNLLEQAGALGRGTLDGGRPALYARPAWDGLNALALLAAIVLLMVLACGIGAVARAAVRDIRAGRAGRVLDRAGTVPGMLAVFALGYGVGMGAWGLVVITFDRYLWMLVLPIYALFLCRPGPAEPLAGAADPEAAQPEPNVTGVAGRRRPGVGVLAAWAMSIALLGALGATSVVLTLNADAFDSARWQIGELAVARGFAPGTIDAGLEWVAFHAEGDATPYAPGQPGRSRYDAWWPSFRLCAMASASPITRPGWELIASRPAAYRLFLFAGRREPLYLYRVTGQGCT